MSDIMPHVQRRMLKYPLFRIGEIPSAIIRLRMPPRQFAEFVAMQDGVLTLWAMDNNQYGQRERAFMIVGTGHVLPAEELRHCGSGMDGPFVWHLFEIFE